MLAAVHITVSSTQGDCYNALAMVHIVQLHLPGMLVYSSVVHAVHRCVCNAPTLSQMTECMRQVMEPLLFAGGVDLVFTGYVLSGAA